MRWFLLGGLICSSAAQAGGPTRCTVVELMIGDPAQAPKPPLGPAEAKVAGERLLNTTRSLFKPEAVTASERGFVIPKAARIELPANDNSGRPYLLVTVPASGVTAVHGPATLPVSVGGATAKALASALKAGLKSSVASIREMATGQTQELIDCVSGPSGSDDALCSIRDVQLLKVRDGACF
jgi:hypothetical protein